MVQKYTEPVVRQKVEEDTNNEYSLLNLEQKGKKCSKTGKVKKKEMTIKHNTCGHIYTLDIYEFMEGKRRCGKCKGKVLQSQNVEDIEVIKFKTKEITENEYTFVDDHYTNSKTKHNFLHHACGTVFKKSWDKFRGTPQQAGQRCTTCYQKGMESVASRYVRDILDHLYITYECEKRFNDCINPETGYILPFDYYIPEINTLVEIDGEHHERGSFSMYEHEDTVKRDEIKNQYAEKKGIELVRIPAKKWSKLPEFLYEILSKNIIPTLTLKEIKEIPQSSHPARINKDLLHVHNGEYALHDPYYFGVDRAHNFQHSSCGNIFKTTLYRLKTDKYPCPVCREKKLKQNKHDKSNKQLIKKSQGRYSLDTSNIGIDTKGRRLIHCNRCDQSWLATMGNLMQDKTGCPHCLEIQIDTNWVSNYNLVVKALQSGIILDKKQKNWVWWNKRKHSEGKLKVSRVNLLIKANLNLL